MDQVRAKKIAHFLDNVNPRIDIYLKEVWLAKAYSKEEEREAWNGYDKLWEILQRLDVTPERWGSIWEDFTEEEYKQAIDDFIDELLTYEKRSPLALCLFNETSFMWDDLWEDQIDLAVDLCPELFPELFERKTAREKKQKERIKKAQEKYLQERSKQAD